MTKGPGGQLIPKVLFDFGASNPESNAFYAAKIMRESMERCT